MSTIFKAKSPNAYIVKILAELLQNNIKTACFEVDKSGIKLCMMDAHKTILINVTLDSENFSIYKFKPNKKMCLGINLNHFHKMLRSIKKKDSVELYIKDDEPTDLGIKVIPRENTRITTSFIKIQTIQTLDIDIPKGYKKPIIVPSSDYQKTCKDMSHIGKNINIIAKKYHIQFKCNAGGVLKRIVEFGEIEDDSDDDDTDDENTTEYNQFFSTEQLSKITKISGLGGNMQIYARKGLPLLFRSPIGDLGKISIYIKSKEELENEQKINEESDDEDNDL
jgi:proliferating cell nuclear antigen